MDLERDVEVALRKGLSFELYRALVRCYGKRGEKAFRYLVEGRVKRYRDFFVVVGREEYVVDENFCTCKDFQINLKFKSMCAHMIAVEVARRLGIYDFVDAYYVDYLDVSGGF